ncbi:hypothetical protein HGA13_14735 [Nocardia speluncae]|uniref:Excreted virulence factor EspC (Type VII ESX diderm) n=1 Tax=Nocardia speluncae TaxID=419477 RepID=A0A846XKL6_9NOCA|nr:hypothetical protein [Nocardia speluncae]NKY34324.1 hypothetical protein [Nocardia speluncae]
MSTGEVGVQGDGLVSLADKMRGSAGEVNKQVAVVDTDMVGSADTGFAYEAQGNAIHAALTGVQQWLKDWSEAVQLTGDALGETVVTMTTVDQENSEKTQQAAS